MACAASREQRTHAGAKRTDKEQIVACMDDEPEQKERIGGLPCPQPGGDYRSRT